MPHQRHLRHPMHCTAVLVVTDLRREGAPVVVHAQVGVRSALKKKIVCCRVSSNSALRVSILGSHGLQATAATAQRERRLRLATAADLGSHSTEGRVEVLIVVAGGAVRAGAGPLQRDRQTSEAYTVTQRGTQNQTNIRQRIHAPSLPPHTQHESERPAGCRACRSGCPASGRSREASSTAS